MNRIFTGLAAAFAVCLISEAVQANDVVRGKLCIDGSDRLCSIIPADMQDVPPMDGYTPTTNDQDPRINQADFDYFGWQMFIALNWPADESGQPLGGDFLDDPDAPRVWESYPGIEQVFAGSDLNAGGCTTAGRLLLSRSAKLNSSSFIQPGTPWPLIDMAGNFVMYDVRLNPAEVAYIRTNGLDTYRGQVDFAADWNLPRGIGDTPGAIEIKTAWRVLPESEDNPMGYFTLPATLSIAAENSETGAPLCLDVTVGLVGMHIMQKVSHPEEFSKFWVWATFEHSRNAPTAKAAPVSALNAHAAGTGKDPVDSCPIPDPAEGDWAFFDAACRDDDGAACTPNAPLGKDVEQFLWQPDQPFGANYLQGDGFGSQVTRCWAVYDSAQKVDTAFQAALAGSVWANYQLIGVQWAQGAHYEGGEFDPLQPFTAPFYLANTSMETFKQIEPIMADPDTPNRGGSGSCTTCHDAASDAALNRSDFSFLGSYAK